MDNLHLSVIAVVLYFNLPGSVGTKSRWILFVTHHHSDCRWDSEFLLNCSFTGMSAIPEDISQTAITADFSYNNIKTFLCADERIEEWMLKHLNLSNNLISELSLTTCRNLPALEILNLNGNAIHTLTLDVPTPAHGSKKCGKGCRLLPALKVLSVERNNLNTVPRGLGLLQSLQTVRLSSNGIQQIDLNDFQNCSQLKDIDLQNNKITKIHPDAFRDLHKLQVVDLRENALTIPLPQILISLNFFQLEVGNGVSWWTPKGRISKDNSLPHMTLDKMNNLVIHNAEKTDEGLYLCIFNTKKKKYLIYNIQVKERVSSFLVRRARDTNTVFRQRRTEQDLALAVCLSVLITFVCAFCLGAFARPYLVSLWRFMRRNKNSGSEHTYSNQAFSDGTLSRECSASKPTNTQHNLFICDENSSRNTCIFPTETSILHENVIGSSVQAPNTLAGDSSSDEGTPFTMSDCSSLADFEWEQPDVSDNLPVCQSSLEEANTNSGTKKFSTPPESPNIAAELQHIGKKEDENNAYFETTINYDSDTIMPETASLYAGKCSDHVSMSHSDTISSSSQEVPDMFDYFTNAESTVQNSVSDSLHNQNTDFGNTLLLLKRSPTYDTDAENTSEEAELQLYQFPIEPQHSRSFSPTEQKENAPERSTDEHIDRNSSEKNHGEGDITLRHTSTSEDNDFIFAPTDTGLNEIVTKRSLQDSSNESSLQSLPEHTAEKHVTVITEKDDLLPQGKQVNTTEACAEKTQRGFNEKDCDGYTELQDNTSNCSLPEETQSCNLTADLLRLPSSGKTQSDFNTEDHFQLDQSDEDAYSFSVPQSFFSESTRCSSCSFPQKTTGNTISGTTDSSKTEDDTTLTGLDNNSTTAVNLQNSSEKLSQKSQTNLGQGQFFVKKKRAFDGFANVLQSRRTNFNS
ncbi:PREDICTED: leucine-rich repeat-containing protein 66 [Fulmarus glacialis]|uniref:leucine-rich repeat-containing protein 66 n=1 Tax=Fulmarus glacialis TaxID=30455 RepID=UPI00051B054E|nr:PREDICTED: leucine-rich repeat-containing protein 66 [Fulmarus glacialis]